MSEMPPESIPILYSNFHSPTTNLNCGEKCAPYNVRGVPFCCDTSHAVPSAYQSEWQYLLAHTDLWHEWQAETCTETTRLQADTPLGQVLVECQGYMFCQRQFRTITCRAFPFFPYVSLQGVFIGLSYYWDYEGRCWIISNMSKVTQTYRQEFINVYDAIFKEYPTEKANFRYHAIIMRRIFGRRHRTIPLLHRNGGFYKVSPHNGRMRRVQAEAFPTFYPYDLETNLPFPEEAA